MRSVLTAILLVFALALFGVAQGAYTQFDYPGAMSTFAYGINNAGDIVCFYNDTAGKTHGFLYSRGLFTNIDYPGSGYTEIFGVNNAQQMVGFTSTSQNFGFFYDPSTGTYTPVKYRGSGTTHLCAINDQGEFTGWADISTGRIGFRGNGVQYQVVMPFGASFVTPTGITEAGTVVGYIETNDALINFSGRPEHFKRLDINVSSPVVIGVNPQGSTVVGSYSLAQADTARFLYEGGVLKTIQPSGSTYAFANGVNDSGLVVGDFAAFDGGAFHGFLWTPPSTPQKGH